MPTLLSIGHGYTAQALAAELLAEGWQIIGTTRRADRLGPPSGGGVDLRLWPGEPLAALIRQATHVLVSVPPGPEGDPVLAEARATLAREAGRLAWVGYLSTTAVYGDRGGAWVDERTPPRPTSERGRWRLAAERDWQALAAESGLPLHIFRLAGIYGPGRGPFAKLRAGRARRIVRPGQVFGRIHVDDIAQVLRASMRRPNPGGVYNVTDDEPAPPEEVLAHAARLLGLPVPPAEPFESAALSPMARSFYEECKRVRADRIRDELGVRLRFPTYREGLADILSREGVEPPPGG